MIPALSAVLVGFLVLVAIVTALLRDVLAAVIVFAAYSLGMAILWAVLQAPDVALTEAAVGAGVTTSLFLVALRETRQSKGPAVVQGVRASSVVACLAVLGVVWATVPSLPAMGDPAAPAFERVSPYYLDNAVPHLGIENVVTAILAGYRGFDTFGEVTVVFAAAIAVLVVFGKEVF